VMSGSYSKTSLQTPNTQTTTHSPIKILYTVTVAPVTSVIISFINTAPRYARPGTPPKLEQAVMKIRSGRSLKSR